MNVQGVALNSANVRYDNANEETRVYDIESNVNIQISNVNGFDSGIVKENGVQVATFSVWGNNLNPSFINLDVTKMCDVLMAINDFTESVKAHVENNPIAV